MVEIQGLDWTTARSVTPDDSVDNVVNAQYLHNSGTGGLATIVFADTFEVAFYFAQGQTLRGGRWKRVKATDLGAGVELVALY